MTSATSAVTIMADDSSKLKAKIAFLTNLIKCHKQTTSYVSGSRTHVSSMNKNISDKSKSSFSWQRPKQPDKEKKQPAAGPPRNHSYSLDRRKMTSSSSGSNTTVTRLNVPGNSGLSGSSWTTCAKDTKSISNNKSLTRQNESKPSTSTPTISSSTALLPPQTVLPQKSVNTHHSSSSQPSRQVTARNPYVLNKKETFSVCIPKSAVAQKSALRWSKPSASSGTSSEDSKSLSDSELYTKKSNFPSTGQLPRSAMVQHKVPPMSNVQGSFKWSKTKPTASSSLSQKKSAKKSKPPRSKLKWTKPGASVEVGIKRKLNPYVLRKENTASGSAGKKQGVLKTANKTKVIRGSVHAMQKKILQNQTSHVWRSQSVLKLDRRKGQSKALSPRSSGGFTDRHSVVRSKRKQAAIKAQKLNKEVVIGGVSYKTSSNKLTKARTSSTEKQSGSVMKSLPTSKIGKLTKTVTIQGEKFLMDSKGKTLQRISKAPRRASTNEPSSSKPSQTPSGRRRSSNGHMVIFRSPTTLVRSKVTNTPSKILASRVLRRSINSARRYKKNKKTPATQQYCMFYNRFGKCNKRDTCPYIHDPSKVAVCTKFLRGRCKNVDGSCPFSHKIDRDKMPVCQFFLHGKCSNDNCPYSHVNVSKKAEVCEDFLKGFCSRGQQCNKKHILECEEFSTTGKCSKGSKCKLMHRARKPAAARKRKSSLKEEKESSKLSKLDFTSDEGFLPLSASDADSEQASALDPSENTSGETKEKEVEPVVIRPRFLKPKEPGKETED